MTGCPKCDRIQKEKGNGTDRCRNHRMQEIDDQIVTLMSVYARLEDEKIKEKENTDRLTHHTS